MPDIDIESSPIAVRLSICDHPSLQWHNGIGVAMKSGKLIRILIADDHIVVRVGLKQLLSTMGGVVITGEAATGRQVLDMCSQKNEFDLLLLDLSMPDIGGFDLVSRLREAENSPPILVFSMHKEHMVAKRAFQMGASGFVSKGSTQEVLMAAVYKVASGGRFVDPELPEQIIFGSSHPGAAIPHERLSGRELDILKLFAKGKTGNEIAAHLSISKKTVSTHKTHLMQKMNFRNITELVIYALDNSLIE